jgi:prepilin-type N-terminal cleavage/methylation domain-containing protein
MKLNNKNGGFTLIELMIVVAIIAIIASVAIPKLMSARLAANESAAISTLRSISSSQAQFQSTASVDSDGDGGGEYGYFGEMSGAMPLREYDPVADAPTIGADLLQPAMLSGAFGDVEADGAGDGVVARSGYYFKMFLPQATAGGTTDAQPEDPAGGATAGSEPDPNNCEILWCCYAWPVEAGKSGNRTFFINQDGDVLQFANKAGTYSDLANGPAFDAAFSDATGGTDMSAPLAINGATANDGNLWTVLQ